MRYRKLTRCISQYLSVSYMLQAPIKPMQLQIHIFDDKRDYMEFRGNDRVIGIGALQVPWNSMEFHGTAGVIEIGPLY